MMTFFRQVTLAACLMWVLFFAVSCGGQAQLTGGIPLPSLDDEAGSNRPGGRDQAGDEGAGSLNPQRPIAPEPIATAVPAMPIPPPAMEPYAYHTVAVGESLTYIAELYETEIETLVRLNELSGPDAFIQIDQVLRIPLATDEPGPSDFILPDSEVIYSPAYVDFDIAKFAKKKGGYLVDYVEYVDGYARTGPEIIELIAERFGVGPRLLLALLEHYGGWVTNPTLSEEKISMPLGPRNIYANSLYHGLAFTANRINAGYYGYKRDGFWVFELADYSRAVTPQGLNAGTVGIQNLLAVHSDGDTWLEELGPNGLMATYRKLFGDPAKYALKQPVVPFDLTQPPLSLPWGQGKGFYFTSGPHSGYIDGSAWAAVDFGPPDVLGSCFYSAEPITAAADGVIIVARTGEIYLDLDGDGNIQTGWTLLYLHAIADAEEPVSVGEQVQQGDVIGYASCEGGLSSSSHLHLARRYNGEWMDAGGPVPLNLSGWVFQPTLTPYHGTAIKDGQVREACECWEPDLNLMVNEGIN